MQPREEAIRQATCRAGVQLAHAGQCSDLSVPPACPTDCRCYYSVLRVSCTALLRDSEDQVVCGSDGNAYRSGIAGLEDDVVCQEPV